ncbi:MAM and LDL-receptor class A domain-containing protein 2-like, partial [Elysia marginata]
MISLDDIKTVDGACPNPGTCNFDEDLCGYTSLTFDNDNRQVDTESRWIRLVSNLPMSSFGPHKDHTDTQQHGGYVFSDQFLSLFVDTEQTTTLVSPLLSPANKACLVFWFFFYGR